MVGLAISVVVAGSLTGAFCDASTAVQAFEKQEPGEHATARAYEEPLPAVTRLATMELKVLDDATGRPISGVEVIVPNSVEGKRYTLRADVGGILKFDYVYVGNKPVLGLELRKEGYVPLRYECGAEGLPETLRDGLTFRLRHGITMGGIVVDEAYHSVNGATVVMTVGKYGAGKRDANPKGNEENIDIVSQTGRDGR